MNIIINIIIWKKRLGKWLLNHPQTRQWIWFVGLWLAGLVAVTLLTYPIKLLIKFMR